MGAPQRLQQIFWNLWANAAKFTPAGGSIRLALAGALPPMHAVVQLKGSLLGPVHLAKPVEPLKLVNAVAELVRVGRR